MVHTRILFKDVVQKMDQIKMVIHPSVFDKLPKNYKAAHKYLKSMWLTRGEAAFVIREAKKRGAKFD